MLYRLLRQTKPDAAPFLRFCLVGLVNTFLHFCVLNLLVEVFACPTTWANVAGFLVANTFSYYANSFWSFKVRPGARSYSRFFVTSVVGTLISYAAMDLGQALNCLWRLVFLFQVSLLALINFTLLRLFVFPRRDETQKGAPPRGPSEM
ncbi:MAG: GtrA family protein [Puniceicoccales bacterium]|nr:GtrA family protein [Puniceicoccales bacterium]